MIGDLQTCSEESFNQFEFDNADFYIWTIDGYGTFHGWSHVCYASLRS